MKKPDPEEAVNYQKHDEEGDSQKAAATKTRFPQSEMPSLVAQGKPRKTFRPPQLPLEWLNDSSLADSYIHLHGHEGSFEGQIENDTTPFIANGAKGQSASKRKREGSFEGQTEKDTTPSIANGANGQRASKENMERSDLEEAFNQERDEEGDSKKIAATETFLHLKVMHPFEPKEDFYGYFRPCSAGFVDSSIADGYHHLRPIHTKPPIANGANGQSVHQRNKSSKEIARALEDGDLQKSLREKQGPTTSNNMEVGLRLVAGILVLIGELALFSSDFTSLFTLLLCIFATGYVAFTISHSNSSQGVQHFHPSG